MATPYDDALTALYRAPHDGFVSERKRLAAELKAAGDREGAAKLAKLARPPISAWVVNQLWWEERETFEALLSAAERLRAGELQATDAHRAASNALRTRAAELLAAAGHSVNEATLRRVTQNLSALAAIGGFDPDPPGALSKDRDPPGFEAFGETTTFVKPPPPSTEPNDAERAREREREAEERRKAEARARKEAERRQLEASLRTADSDIESRTRDVEALRARLTEAEAALERARLARRGLEARLAALDGEDES